LDQVFSRQPFGPASVVRHHDARELVVVESEEDFLCRISGHVSYSGRQPHEFLNQLRTLKGDLPKVTWEKIIEHIDHAVKTAGVDHVGLGSDFDGATMPLGMEDASKLPKITDALLKKGYSEANVEKILGGNILRVMEAVERLKGHPACCACRAGHRLPRRPSG
jgi:microsomal dipeptidase-like Zn-dependent dipeptidase